MGRTSELVVEVEPVAKAGSRADAVVEPGAAITTPSRG